MDSPRIIPEAQTLTPSSSGRRKISFDSSSPEFEFWMVRNPSYPEPNLHSADELFVDGFLLPLHLLSHHHHQRDPPPEPEPPNSGPHLSDPEPHPPPDPEPEPGSGPKITAESTAPLSASKRWRDIFKKGDKKSAKPEQEDSKDKDKEKKKERKSGAGSGSAAELNINIWPFSRSRSAGNTCTRPKTMFGAPGSRKVNSAPCSRSNSAGESKSRKWPSSPSRAGVHLGRSSPVWQVRRGGSAGGGAGRSVEPLVRNAEKGAKKDAPDCRRNKPTAAFSAAVNGGAGGGGPAKAKVLNINVPMCIGYRNHLSCRSDENSALSVGTSESTTAGGGGKIRSGGAGGGGSGGGGRGGGVGSVGNGGNLFNLRSLFTKKVY